MALCNYGVTKGDSTDLFSCVQNGGSFSETFDREAAKKLFGIWSPDCKNEKEARVDYTELNDQNHRYKISMWDKLKAEMNNSQRNILGVTAAGDNVVIYSKNAEMALFQITSIKFFDADSYSIVDQSFFNLDNKTTRITVKDGFVKDKKSELMKRCDTDILRCTKLFKDFCFNTKYSSIATKYSLEESLSPIQGVSRYSSNLNEKFAGLESTIFFDFMEDRLTAIGLIVEGNVGFNATKLATTLTGAGWIPILISNSDGAYDLLREQANGKNMSIIGQQFTNRFGKGVMESKLSIYYLELSKFSKDIMALSMGAHNGSFELIKELTIRSPHMARIASIDIIKQDSDEAIVIGFGFPDEAVHLLKQGADEKF